MQIGGLVSNLIFCGPAASFVVFQDYATCSLFVPFLSLVLGDELVSWGVKEKSIVNVFKD